MILAPPLSIKIKSLNLSIDEIGEKTGIDPEKISLFERGRLFPSDHERNLIAKALSCQVSDIFSKSLERKAWHLLYGERVTEGRLKCRTGATDYSFFLCPTPGCSDDKGYGMVGNHLLVTCAKKGTGAIVIDLFCPKCRFRGRTKIAIHGKPRKKK